MVLCGCGTVKMGFKCDGTDYGERERVPTEDGFYYPNDVIWAVVATGRVYLVSALIRFSVDKEGQWRHLLVFISSLSTQNLALHKLNSNCFQLLVPAETSSLFQNPINQRHL